MKAIAFPAKRLVLQVVCFSFCVFLDRGVLYAQSMLKTSGIKIVKSSDGAEVLLKGINTGNWLVQEPYLLEIPAVNSQGDIKKKLYDSGMTESEVEDFYQSYRNNFITKKDIDFVAKSGFNCVRLPMHYELFLTPAQRTVRNKVIRGEVPYKTYVDKLTTWYQNDQLFNDETTAGFSTLDSMISWCKANNLYLIPDLHAAPGGQGSQKSITDALKPLDLWNNLLYQDITVRFWERLAARYKESPVIAMYDIINEPHDLPSGSNKELKVLLQRLINSIRAKGDKHIILLEGSAYGNDYTLLNPSELTEISDRSNLVYNSHRYWIPNSMTSVEENPNKLRMMKNILDWRAKNNVPVFVGETSENSNHWIYEANQTLNAHGIGWTHWNLKRIDRNNQPLIAAPYGDILTPNGRAALVTNIQFDNCTQRKDMLDALLRNAGETTVPYATLTIPGTVNAVNFDMGRDGYAYHDTRIQRLAFAEDRFWNASRAWGGFYRNDGVDIEKNTDVLPSNGYHIGYMDKGEWLSYTINVLESKEYMIRFRVSNGSTNGLTGKLSLQLDSIPLGSVLVKNTGGWSDWQTLELSKPAFISAGSHKATVFIDDAKVNLNWIDFEIAPSKKQP